MSTAYGMSLKIYFDLRFTYKNKFKYVGFDQDFCLKNKKLLWLNTQNKPVDKKK